MKITAEHISLRAPNGSDLPLLLAWRQDPEIMQYLPSAPKRPTWEDQVKFWKSAISLGYFRQMVHLTLPDMVDGHLSRPVGEVHYYRNQGEIGLLIGEKALWGQGVGRIALRKYIEDLQKGEFLPEQELWAMIHPRNLRSQRLFMSLGFEEKGEGRNRQVKFVWKGFPK